MKKILIVANQTAAGAHLRALVGATVGATVANGGAEFVLLVPATPPTTGLVWTRGQATALAEWRMNEAIERLRALGANIRGVVGDGRALDAIDDILQEERFDEIVLSTLPVGASRWLRQDLPHRLRRRYEIPVRHVVDTSRGMADPLVRIERVLRVAS